MIKNIKIFTAMIMAFLMICVLMPVSVFAVIESGTEMTIELGWVHKTDADTGEGYGSYTVTADGVTSQAFCFEAGKRGTVGGSFDVTVYECTNDKIRAVLYFGYNGPEEIEDCTEYGTHLAACYYYTGGTLTDGYDVTSEDFTVSLYEYAEAHYSEVPDSFHVYYAESVGGDGYQTIGWWEYTPGYLTLVKSSDVTESWVTCNSAYSLAGAVYGVYASKSGAAGDTDRIGTLTTASDGTTNTLELDIGTYYVKEVTASTGYEPDTETHEVTVKENETAAVTSSEPVKADSLTLTLYKTNEDGEDCGGIEGAVFRVTYTYTDTDGEEISLINYYVTDSSGTIDCADTAYLCDSEGNLDPAANSFPIDSSGCISVYAGTVTVEEVISPDGYLMSADTLVRTVTVSSDGTISHSDAGGSDFISCGTDSYYVANETIRGNLSFIKLDADGNAKAYTPFLISLIVDDEVAEQHVVLTDENGSFDSSALTNSNNTNALDEYLSDDAAAYEGECDADAASCGVWFYKDTTTVDDDKGAFVYGTYLIQELSCDSNEGEDLLSGKITVSEDSETVFAGYFVDLEVDISTQLLDKTLGAHMTFLSDEATLVETINYTSLKTTSQYYFLVNICDEDGEAVASARSEAFSPKASSAKTNTASGSMDIEIALSTLGLEGQALHAEVKLYICINDAWALIGIYNSDTDEPDEEETVYVPSLDTVAVDSQTKDHVGAAETTGIIDTVSVTNLLAGESYTLYETLYVYDGETGKLLTEEVTEKTFSAVRNSIFTSYTHKYDSGNLLDKTVTMPGFEIDASDLQGLTVVVYEELWRVDPESGEKLDDIAIATHESLIDEDQSIYYPGVGTSAADSETGTDEGTVSETAVIVDLVECTNLIIGQEYTITGYPVYQEDYTYTASDGTVYEYTAGDMISYDEDASTDSVTFTASAQTEVYELTYVIDSTLLAGTSVVIFEDLEHNGVKVAAHHDIDDEDQTVNYPGISTSAADSNGSKYVTSAAEGNIIDTVTYKNFIPGEEYTVTGTLMDKETGEAITDADGNEITQTVTFTPEESDGTIEMVFTVSANTFYGTAVVFEKVVRTSTGVTVAAHEDIDDADQTVCFPEIGTTLTTKDGEKSISPNETLTLVDTVTYTNLEAGQTYTVYGVLMDKESEEAAVDGNGNKITGQTTFTADTTNGTVTVEFTFDPDGMEGEYTAFEELYKAVPESLDEEGNVITEEYEVIYALHTDFEDAAQTITIYTEDEETPGPKTGDTYRMWLWIALAAAALSGIGVVIAIKRVKE